jgi:hypothetical protein
MIKKALLLGVIILLSASCTVTAPTPDSSPGGSLGPTPTAEIGSQSSARAETLQIPVTSGSTLAPGVTPSDLPPDCMKTAITPLQIDRCAESNAHRADLKMEQLLEAVRNSLSGEQLDEFKTLQARWEALASSLCGWEVGNIQDAALSRQVFSTCMQQQDLDRVQELKPLLCPDRGLSGPCPASNQY